MAAKRSLKQLTIGLAVGSALSISCGGMSFSGAVAQTLPDALSIAYRTNPTIRAARAQFDATEELKPQARAAALPNITGGANYTFNDVSNTINFGAGPEEGSVEFETRAYQFQAEQPVFTGLRNFNAVRQARARVRAGGAELIGAEQQVLLQAAEAYFDVLREETVYETNLSNVKVLVRRLDEAKLRFEVGEITKTDVAQAEARLAGARAELARAQATLASARAAFKQVIGSMPATLEDDPKLPDTPQTEEQAQNFARQYAPNVLAARASADASKRDIAIARSAFVPQVSLTAGYTSAREPSFFVLESDELTYGARASMPIFQGGLNISRVREAKARNTADRQRVEEAERAAAANVTRAWEQLVAARATIRSAKAQVDANELALEGVRRESQVGTRTTLDVLNAEQELLNSNVALANAQREERAGVFGLLAAAGVLSPEALGITLGE
ncbi:MAG: TolC family outer membrane protein [Pseudomonadota bacterium]